MNFNKETLPSFTIQNKDILKITDPFALGIFAFMKMKMSEAEYTIPALADKIKEHFEISYEQIMNALEVITKDLELTKIQ